MRKKIGSLLREGHPLVRFDEVQTKIYHPALAQVLTETMWKDRQLGVSTMMTYPNTCLWVASGNNVSIGGDFHRRVVLVRLRTDEEHPELRKDFEIRDFLATIKDLRVFLIQRLLLIAKGWLDVPQADRPYGTVSVGASFDRWSRIIGGMLAYAGVEGFLENRDKLYEKDQTTIDWNAFLQFWYERHNARPVLMKTIRQEVMGSRHAVVGTQPMTFHNAVGVTPGFKETLPEHVLEDVEKIGSEELQTRALSRHLTKIVDHNFGGYLLRHKTYESSHKAAQWWVGRRPEEAEEA